MTAGREGAAIEGAREPARGPRLPRVQLAIGSLGFVGLPTTVAGLVWSTAFLVAPTVPAAGTLLVACGVAMVSVIPVPRPRGIGMAAFVGWALVLVVAHGALLTVR